MSGIRFTLADDPKAKAIYDELIKSGVKKSEIDRGYYDMSMTERGVKPELVGKGDDEIAPQEVYDYVFANYDKYQGLLQLKTNIFFPFALYDDKFMSDKLKKFKKAVYDLAALITKELNKKGIHRSEDRFYVLGQQAVILAFFDSASPDYIHAQQELKKNGMQSLIPQLMKMGRKIKSGSKDCPSILPLAQHVDSNCKANGFSDLNMSILTLDAADIWVSGYLAMNAESETLMLKFELLTDNGMFLYEEDPQDTWTLSDNRCSFGLYYSFAYMLSSRFDGDSDGRWIRAVRLLLPEVSSTRVAYAQWLLNRPNPDYALVLEELDSALKLNSLNKFAYYFRGLALYGLKRFSEAYLALEEAIKIDPQFKSALDSLALIETVLDAISIKPSEGALEQVVSKQSPQMWTDVDKQPVIPPVNEVFKQREEVPPLIKFGIVR